MSFIETKYMQGKRHDRDDDTIMRIVLLFMNLVIFIKLNYIFIVIVLSASKIII